MAGASRAGCLLFILVALVAAYVGIVVIEGEFDFRSLESEVRRQTANAAHASDEEIRASLVERIGRLGIPLPASDIRIDRQPGNRIQISLQYADTLRFLNRWEVVRPRQLLVQQNY